MKIFEFIETKLGKGLMMLLLGIVLVIVKDNINTEDFGYLLIGVSIVYTLSIFLTQREIKRSKKSKDIKDKEHNMIAYFLEKKRIKYIYKPKIWEEMTFNLPEFNVFIKFWDKGSYNKEKRKKVLKKLKNNSEKVIELFPDNLTSMQQLDWILMYRLLEVLKEK